MNACSPRLIGAAVPLRLTASVAWIVVAGLLAAGCNDTLGAGPNQAVDINPFTPGGPSAPSSAAIVPRTLGWTAVALPSGCAARTGFATDFNLVVDQRHGGDVSVNEVRLQFSDVVGGFSAPPMLFTPADLTGQFGNARVQGGSLRSFGFRPQFGCGFSHPRQMVGTIVLIDASGLSHESSITAAFN